MTDGPLQGFFFSPVLQLTKQKAETQKKEGRKKKENV